MPKGMDFHEAFASDKYLKAGEFRGQEVTLKISGIRHDTFRTEAEAEGGKTGKPKKKLVLSFESTAPGRSPPKDIVCNKTNGFCLKAMFGRDLGEWIGKRVTFFPALVKAFGVQELAIRVRGSPDIPKTFTFKLRLIGKKEIDTTMIKTEMKAKQNGGPQAAAPPAQAQEPPAPGEPPPDALLPGQPGYVSPQEPPPPGDEYAPGGGA